MTLVGRAHDADSQYATNVYLRFLRLASSANELADQVRTRLNFLRAHLELEKLR